MQFDLLYDEMRSEVEEELKNTVARFIPDPFQEIRSMMAYHMGWEGEGAGLPAQGKRIRPIIVLLCAMAAGKDWRIALPAAASVELIHNFSLIHDDIEDKDAVRRGRPTVWVKWGLAQALNAGDSMFTLAHLEIQELRKSSKPSIAFKASKILLDSCNLLTQGQYLDLSFEKDTPGLDLYWKMIGGKTAALLACCTELGALIGGATAYQRKRYKEFGYSLGLAFQVQDDWLGIWGEPAQTGKSNESDLISRKKTLPVLYALEKKGQFAQRWNQGKIGHEEISYLSQLLIEEGAQHYTQQSADRLTDQALRALELASAKNDGIIGLIKLSEELLNRKN